MASPYTADERMKLQAFSGESMHNTRFLSSKSHGRTSSHPQNESELEQFNKMLGSMNRLPNQRNSTNSQIAVTSYITSNGNVTAAPE